MTHISKHIFFVVSVQHFIPTGGIGSFFRGFLRMADHIGWQVTVVLDKKPIGQSREMMEAAKSAAYIWPPNFLPYANHTKATRFSGETINTAKVANFTRSLELALEQSKPDHILINTPDAVQSIAVLGLQNIIPTTFYTHHENLVVPPEQASKVFASSYNDFLYLVPGIKGITTATQCGYNLTRMDHLNFSTPPVVLPMPIPDPQLFVPYVGTRSGVLFIGRHEPRKDPELFAKTVAAAGLPAKVLTNKKGKPKFEKLLAAAGVKAEVRAQITGDKKAKFIQSAKVAFHPAVSESYGFSAMETLAAGLPTLLIEERNWWRAFKDDGVHLTTRENAAADLLDLYGQSLPPCPSIWLQREQDTFAAWQHYLG
jgi:glycosyltransferase involved in cell wall biosynthesis